MRFGSIGGRCRRMWHARTCVSWAEGIGFVHYERRALVNMLGECSKRVDVCYEHGGGRSLRRGPACSW